MISAQNHRTRQSAEGQGGLQCSFFRIRDAFRRHLMSADKPVPISAEGLKKLEELRTRKRQEVAERIHAAMQFGDYSENSELEQAKNDQAFLEGRIQTVEQMVKNAAIIDENEHHDVVEIGSHVTIEQDGERDQYV